MIGIDVSKHNGSIDFNKVKADGYDFVIIRAGYGKSNKDTNFADNVKKALSAGLKIGAYWFIYAKTSNDIIANVRMAHATLNNYKDKLEMGVWADYEYDSDRYVGRQLSVQERTAWVKTFIEGMKSNGYDCGLYANPDYLDNKFGNLKSYKLWIARYTDNADKVKDYKPFMWQYTSYGKVNGIKGNVDLNKCEWLGLTAPKKCCGVVATNGSNLMLRAGASTKDKILKKIPNGKHIGILDKDKYDGEWYKVCYENTIGYAFSKYIKEI